MEILLLLSLTLAAGIASSSSPQAAMKLSNAVSFFGGCGTTGACAGPTASEDVDWVVVAGKFNG